MIRLNLRILAFALAVFAFASCKKKNEVQQISDTQSEKPFAVDAEALIQPKEDDAPTLDFATNVELSSVSVEKRAVRPITFIEGWEENIISSTVREASVMYFLGFSEDGKICYMQSDYREGRGDTVLTLFVQDLATDKILFDVSLSNEEAGFTESSSISFIEFFLEKNRSAIEVALNRYSIRDSECTFKALPYKGSMGEISVLANITAKQIEDEWLPSVTYELKAYSASAEKIIEKQNDRRIWGVYPCGFIKNPYEERIAVVVAESQFGFEGADIMYHVVGCDLETGL